MPRLRTMVQIPTHNDINDHDESPSLPCAEKLVFDTQRQAAASANVADYQHGAKVAPYVCQFCGLWHLASY